MKYLPGARFTRDQDGLVHVLSQHGTICSVADGKHVWRHLVSSLALVNVNNFRVVDREPLVRIDYHQEEAGVSLSQR